MKEKLGTSMILSICLMLLILMIVLICPEFFASTVEAKSFANGISSALLCCVAGMFACFKYRKK